MSTDRALQTQQAGSLLANHAQGSPVNPMSCAHQLAQRHFTAIIPVDASSAATQNVALLVADRPYTVVSCRVKEFASVASDTSNYVTWNLVSDNDAAASSQVVASVSTAATAVVAMSSVNVPLIASAVNISSGYGLYIQTAKVGTGTSRTKPGLVDVVLEEV